jgi:hypothetical protein
MSRLSLIILCEHLAGWSSGNALHFLRDTLTLNLGWDWRLSWFPSAPSDKCGIVQFEVYILRTLPNSPWKKKIYILREDYKMWSSLLYNFLNSPVPPSIMAKYCLQHFDLTCLHMQTTLLYTRYGQFSVRYESLWRNYRTCFPISEGSGTFEFIMITALIVVWIQCEVQ